MKRTRSRAIRSKRAEFGAAFGHSTGHGLGLGVHEAPRLARTVNDPLPENAVVTIRARRVHIAGSGGVRIEDDVHLSSDGPVFADGRPYGPRGTGVGPRGVSSRYEARHHRPDCADPERRAGGGRHRDPPRSVRRMVVGASVEGRSMPAMPVGLRARGSRHVTVSHPGAAPASSDATGCLPPAPSPQFLEIRVAHGGHVLRSPRSPGREPYVKVGSARDRGAGRVHHRSDEDHERDRVRGRRAWSGSDRADNAQPVEFGQALFRVDPHG